VRKYLKKDEHIVLAVLGMYGGIYGLVRLKSALSAKPVPAAAPVVAAAASTGPAASKYGYEFPTIENFDTWSNNADNWAKWEEFMSSPKFDLWLDGKL